MNDQTRQSNAVDMFDLMNDVNGFVALDTKTIIGGGALSGFAKEQEANEQEGGDSNNGGGRRDRLWNPPS